MAGVADSAAIAMLEIPESALQSIKDAEKAIKSLQATSATAAQKIKGHFDNTAVSGLNAFIQKVKQAQGVLGNTTMPKLDATSFATSISDIATAMATVDRSATTGSKRLERIADAVSKLSASTPAYAAFKDIADGITLIGSTSDATIAKVSALASTMATLARDIRTVTAARSADAEKTASAAQYNKLYKEQADLTRKINEIKEKGASADLRELTLLSKMQDRWTEINAQIDKLNNKKQTAASILAQFTGANRVGDAQARTTVSGAINYAQQAMSLRELQDAYKNLKAVMATVDPKSAAWKQMNVVLQETKSKIDDIRKKMGEFNSISSRSGDIVGQLRNRIAAAFSVAAITGFINRMVRVRAEFELQNVALRAILQNKEEADRIFSQVQQMALQSPFSIMQLTSYTKQLAAYRIEADKLIGTTKMLADVSAGLGVDIGRLILAYGQVKSANYLRATEIRQFTEAGLNIAGELATYFSELQGKMVSVGDVMEMVTKRMVSFGDVEEVFKRITSAGGIFYDMQKKQSETLSGQLQRIKDAIDIMFNDMGKSNQGVISWILKSLRYMIEHWREVAVLIKAVGLSMAAFYLRAKILPMIATWVKGAAEAVKNLGGAFKSASLSLSGLGTILKSVFSASFLGLIGAVGGAIFGLIGHTDALKDSLKSIQADMFAQYEEMNDTFVNLANTITDTSKTQMERNEAFEELNRVFGEILPKEMLEIDYLTTLAGSYEEVTAKLREYYQVKEYEEMNAEVKKTREQKVGEKAKELTKEIYNELTEEAKSRISKAELEQWIRGFVREYATLSKDEIEKLAPEEFKKAFGENAFAFDSFLEKRLTEKHGTGYVDITDVFDVYNEYSDKIIDIVDTKNWAATMEERLANKEAARISEQKKAIRDYIEDNKKLIKAYVAERDKLMKMPENFGKTAAQLRRSNTAFNELYNNAEKAFTALNIPIPQEGIDKSTENIYKLNDLLDHFSKYASINASESVLDLKKYFGELGSTLENVLYDLNGVNQNLEKGVPIPLDLNRIVDGIREVWERVGGKYGTDFVNRFTSEENLMKNEQESNEQYTKRLKQIYDERQKIIEQYYKYTDEISREAFLNREQMSKKMFDQIEKDQKGFKSVILELDPTSFDKKGGRQGEDTELKRWQNVKKAIEDTAKSYEEYRKSFSKGEADKRIYEQYEKVFKNLGVKISDYFKDGVFDAKALINALKTLKDQLSDTSSARAKAINDILLEIEGKGIELDVKLAKDSEDKVKADIENMFANYELTKELASFGLNVDLAFVVGGEPMSLHELDNKLHEQFQKLGGEAAPTNIVKMYKEYFKKIDNLELNSQKERLKNLHKYTLEAVSDRMRIEMKAQEEINKIRQSEDMGESTKNLAIDTVLKKKQEDLDKLAWETFQSSDLYIDLFENIEYASKKSIDSMIEKIESLKDSLKSLPADQVRAIVKQLDKLKERSAQMSNPFGLIIKNVGPAIKAIQRAKKAQKELGKAQSDLDDYKKQRAYYRDLTVTLGEKLKIAKKNKNASKEEVEQLEQQQQSAKVQYEVWTGIVNRQQQTVDGLEEEKKKAQELKEKLAIGFGGASAIFGQISQSVTQIKDDWQQIFGTQSDEFNDTMDTISDVTAALSELTAGIETIMKGDVIGGVIQTVTGVFSMFASLFAIGDKKKERQIKKLKEQVEDLDRAYQRLEKSIEKAYTFESYNADYAKMRQNLAQQKKDYEDMLALEKSKKKYDKDAIKEYEDKINELADKQDELRKQRIEAMGSTTDYLNEAQSFVDAWLDACREVGDGTDALKENWDEFIDNLAVKQAASAVLSAQMKSVIEKINSAIDEGKTGLDLSDTVKKATAEFKDKAGVINEGLKEFFDAMGVSLSKGELTLSDLQKGIQNITEPQAAAIEAYLNSMRFEVFKHTEQLERLITAIQIQYGSGVENPIVTELKGVRNAVENIEKMLNKVIVSPSQNNTSSGYAIKVR